MRKPLKTFITLNRRYYLVNGTGHRTCSLDRIRKDSSREVKTICYFFRPGITEKKKVLRKPRKDDNRKNLHYT